MPVPPLNQVDLLADSPVPAYVSATTAVCPFIHPSVKANLLFTCEISPDCQTAADIHPRLFEQLVPLIERFREARRALPGRHDRLLICHTVILRMPPQLDAAAAQLLRWPNLLGWTLKHIYTSKEIVFGFVRKNVVENSTLGTPIPAAPFHAVILRSRVVGSDHRFFPGNKQLLPALMEADDDGADAHTPIFGTVPDLTSPQAIRADAYYHRIEQWWKKNLPRN